MLSFPTNSGVRVYDMRAIINEPESPAQTNQLNLCYKIGDLSSYYEMLGPLRMLFTYYDISSTIGKSHQEMVRY